MKKISVLLVDDHTVVRQGLKALLAVEADIEVVAEAEDGIQAVKAAKKTNPDVVVMDLAMPMMNGLSATRQILKAVPETKIVVLSSYSNDECVAEMMKAGASGFLMKQTAPYELLQAIRHASRGGEFLSPELARRIRNKRQGAFMNGNDADGARELTAREVEVLKIIAEGLTNGEIATVLGISIKTVEKHRQQTMNKLNIHEVAGLTRYALAKGLVSGKVAVPAGA
jgi:DNA-binding NarL/FixJ family response regulator